MVKKIIITSNEEGTKSIEIGEKEIADQIKYFIGRDQQNKVAIFPLYNQDRSLWESKPITNNEHRSVSREHLEIIIRNQGVLVRDISSRCGTFYQDKTREHKIDEEGLFLESCDNWYSFRLGNKTLINIKVS